MQQLFDLFCMFFKIGMFTIGGGYAMLPIVQREIVEVRGLLTDEEFLDTISLTNSLPGPLGTNCATFVGYRVGGTKGAVVATFGAMIPSVIIILIIAALFQSFMDWPVVQYIFLGIRPGVAALIFYSILRLQKSARVAHEYNWIMAGFGFLAISFWGLHPVLVILVAAIYGLFFRARLLHVLPGKKEDASR